MGNIIIKPHRHYFWGYNQAGAYFITIVTKDRIIHFGRIEQRSYGTVCNSTGLRNI